MSTPKAPAASILLAACLILAAPGRPSASVRASLETLKTGKDAFISQCLNCHKTVSEAAAGPRKREGWMPIIKDMVARGADLDETRQGAVADYLAGRALLIARCNSCHSYLRPLTKAKSPEEWRSTTERMYGKMPRFFTPEEVAVITDFLIVERPAR